MGQPCSALELKAWLGASPLVSQPWAASAAGMTAEARHVISHGEKNADEPASTPGFSILKAVLRAAAVAVTPVAAVTGHV